jgi:flagellar biosynthesis chaperone FliJ
MSEIVERLLKDAESHYEVARSADMRPEDTLNWEHGQNCQAAADTITRLTAEVEQNAIDLEEYRRDVERLRAALRECEAELNAYYRMEYPGSHPYSQQELAQAMASNPATVALSGDKQ